MTEDVKSLWTSIRSGEFDINNQQLFFSILIKGFLYKLNTNTKLRHKYIPHYILNTGDDIMYLEVKGQDHSIEPTEVSNENFVYSQIPRCMVSPGGINIPTDQLTSPYSHGIFEVDYDDMVYGFRAEFRRIPIVYKFTLKYYVDSFTDAIDVTQQIIANLSFVNKFNITYLGQRIDCSYNIPDSFETEYMMEFDGLTMDSKYRTITLELEVQTNMPIIYKGTVIPSDAYIKTTAVGEVSDLELKHGLISYPKGGIGKTSGEITGSRVTKIITEV